MLAVLAIWLLTGVFLWQQYKLSVDNAERSTRDLSDVMAELAEQSLTVNQLVIQSMLDWIAEEEVKTEEDYQRVASSRSFYDRLIGRIAKLPTIDVATFIATDGTLLNYSRRFPPPPIKLADRDYFIEQMRESGPPYSLGKAVENRGTGQWTFYLAKEVRLTTGTKVGVAITGAGASYFGAQLRRMLHRHQGDDSAHGGAAFLVRDDGVLLAATSDDAPLGTRAFPRRETKGHGQRTQAAAAALGLPSDSLIASSPLTTFPAYVVAVTNPAPLLLEWRRTAWAMVSAGAVLSLLSIGIGWRSYHLLQVRDRVLRQEGERRILSSIFGSPLALAALVKDDGQIIYRNSAFSEMLSPIIRDGRLVSGPEVEGSGALAAFLEGGKPRADFTLRVQGQDCSPAYLRISGARVALEQGDLGTALLGYDDTQRMKSEAHIIQSSKLITLGEMATGMAHELNQPLNVIKMAAQAALFEIEDDEELDAGVNRTVAASIESAMFVKARLQRVVEQVDRAATIIDHMRIFGRVPAGRPPVIDAAATCRSALQLIGHQLRDSEVEVVLRLGDAPLLVKCHPVLLEQVLVNLLLNARDATASVSAAAREICIEVQSVDREVIIIVSDNGPGIPAALRDRVFEPFFTTKSAEQGTGLGLSISYGIVRDSGGRLELLDSAHGCVFRVVLPAAAGAEAVAP
ncbi:ATP-binding protein [Reyranella sp.]|uniref:ATP-binding protein n=1 Tax=Reyranella sp. TaxID=1929291 RepID=UPI003BAA9FDE